MFALTLAGIFERSANLKVKEDGVRFNVGRAAAVNVNESDPSQFLQREEQ